MTKLQLPAFGETDFFDNKESKDTRVIILNNVTVNRLDAYCNLLDELGYTQMQRDSRPHRIYCAYRKKQEDIFLNYFAGTNQLQILTEKKSAYFDYQDTALGVCTTPRLTQVFLSDYGLSDVIRLSDGRLIIIDGANVYEKDIDNLFDRLKDDSPFDKPVIAAWIMTHPHSDHYNCFIPFNQKYGDQVEIQKMFYNFPQHDDEAHYPKLAKDGKAFSNWYGKELTGSDVLLMFRQKVAEMGLPVYTPHTGQSYRIGEAFIQFYGTMDDTIHRSQNINMTSLMFTMELAGQRIFFGGDGSFSDASLAERYGDELKCDILQVPHHGFGCGSAEGQIKGYQYIAPRVCLLPVEKHLAYTYFTTYREGTQYLMTQMNVEEMITGEKNQVLDLPYSPAPNGAYQLQQQYLEGRDNTGARTWVFMDMDTSKQSDFWFSILNSTYIPAEISVEIYPENLQRKVIRRKITGPRLGVFRVNCLLTAAEDPDTVDIPSLMEQLGIPADTHFAVRFMSSIPVIISHPDHQPAYRSSII
jgi:beta-lactamase superfamily II metal-dependent hydrolase